MMMDRNSKFWILAWSQAPETSLLLGIFVTTTSPLHKASAFALMFAHTHTNIVWDYLQAHQYLHTNELVEHFFVFSVGSKFVLFWFFVFFSFNHSLVISSKRSSPSNLVLSINV